MSEQARDDILTHIDREIDAVRSQWRNTPDYTIVLSPEYYRRFVNALTHWTQGDGLTTGEVRYRGIAVIGSKYVPGVGVKLQKTGRDIFGYRLSDMLNALVEGEKR